MSSNIAQQPQTRFRCPVCRKDVARNAEDFPFCSPRCHTIALGRWAGGDYRIAGESVSLPEHSFAPQNPGDDSW